ncbi:MAG: SlyX family protein [Pseudomonadales bacterium]
MEESKVQAQLDDLQSQLAFQEDALSALERGSAAQQKQIDFMQRMLAEVVESLRSLRESTGSGGDMDDQPPPHY